MEEENEQVDLDDIIKEIYLDMYASIGEKNGKLRSERLPVVTGPRLRLRQVFQNLISNGFKYNDSEQPRVEIRCYGTPEGYCFMIRDNGIGIPPEDHEKVFDIFQRLHGQDKYEGSGIGLSIVKKLVESMGGNIGLESKPGEGSTFVVTLPPRSSLPDPGTPTL